MNINKNGTIVLLLSLFLCGCALKKMPATTASYPNCKLDDYCSVAGKFSVVEINHVKMGKVILMDGKCINLSMPSNALKKYKKDEEVSVAGVLYETPAADELTVSLKIDGRRIGWNQCNKTYLFIK
jgi:hypothetical protein